MDGQSTPLFLSPALPSDLLQFIINRCSHPTTLLICSSRADFLSALTQDLLQQQQQHQPQPHPRTADEPHDTAAQQVTADPPNPKPQYNSAPPPANQPLEQVPQPQPHPQPHPKPHPLLTPLLSQLSTTRHIRTVFIPTVSHLRAYLSVFSSSSSSAGTVPPPPPPVPPPATALRPLLVVYNFLSLHRGTSEWSVQGLGASAAGLVEGAVGEGFRVVVVEERHPLHSDGQGDDDDGSGAEPPGMKELLEERVPVLSGSGVRRIGGELEGSGWAGKTVGVGTVLGRWFRFREGEWVGKE